MKVKSARRDKNSIDRGGLDRDEIVRSKKFSDHESFFNT